jgi:AraC family transcriptional regulator
MTDITITEIAPQTVLGIRRRGFYQEQIPKQIMELCIYAEQEKIEMAGMPIFVCHETSVEEAMRAAEEGNADIEVAIPIAAPVAITGEGPDDISCYELPGGTMVKAIHKGPYETCEGTYNEVFAWIEAHGKEITGPIREVYPNDPGEVAPEEILTEIYVPVG